MEYGIEVQCFLVSHTGAGLACSPVGLAAHTLAHRLQRDSRGHHHRGGRGRYRSRPDSGSHPGWDSLCVCVCVCVCVCECV